MAGMSFAGLHYVSMNVYSSVDHAVFHLIALSLFATSKSVVVDCSSPGMSEQDLA